MGGQAHDTGVEQAGLGTAYGREEEEDYKPFDGNSMSKEGAIENTPNMSI